MTRRERRRCSFFFLLLLFLLFQPRYIISLNYIIYAQLKIENHRDRGKLNLNWILLFVGRVVHPARRVPAWFHRPVEVLEIQQEAAGWPSSV